jgi:hypothetical protein
VSATYEGAGWEAVPLPSHMATKLKGLGATNRAAVMLADRAKEKEEHAEQRAARSAAHVAARERIQRHLHNVGEPRRPRSPEPPLRRASARARFERKRRRESRGRRGPV